MELNYSSPADRGKALAEAYEAARDAVIDARMDLDVAEARLERATQAMLDYTERWLENLKRGGIQHGEPLG